MTEKVVKVTFHPWETDGFAQGGVSVEIPLPDAAMMPIGELYWDQVQSALNVSRNVLGKPPSLIPTHQEGHHERSS